MRLDGLDRATVPFAERHVLAWLGGPELDMDPDTLVNVVKVCFNPAPTPNSLQTQPSMRALCVANTSVCRYSCLLYTSPSPRD